MKKVLALILALAMVLTLVACGADKTGDDKGNSGSSSGASADDGKVYEFNLSLHDPLTSNNGKFYQNWADQIAEATNGRVKITLFGSGTLASSTDVVDMVEGGGVDIGWVYTGFFANQYPLSEVTTLVLEGFETCEATTEALWDLYEEYPELQEEWGDYKLLTMYANPANMIMTKDAPVKTLADMKGRSLRSPSGVISSAVTLWGASPIMMAPGDIYQALEKNNISGAIFEPAGVCNFTLQEQLNYFVEMPLFQGVFALVMNWDKWNSLPEDLQNAIMEVSGRTGSIAAAADFEAAANEAKNTIKAAGGEFYELDEAAIAEFKAACASTSEDWAAAHSSDSFDGAAYVDRARELLAKYNG